jgi:cold shock CspA family protein
MANTGRVKFFKVNYGFGLIQLDAGAAICVHVSAVEQSGLGRTREDQKLIFDVVRDRDSRWRAAAYLRRSDYPVRRARADIHVHTR